MTHGWRGVHLSGAAMTIAVAGCSDEQKREYTLPDSLCGVPAPKRALSRLLPAGKHLAVDKATPVADAITTCRASVDGHLVLSLEREIREVGASARDIAVNQLGVKQLTSAERDSVAYADRAAVSVVQCRGGGAADKDISIAVKVLEPGHRNEAAMKELILEYTSAFKKRQPCTETS
ncbi:hypothetical protein ACFRDV_07520 [Streptomyces fagopyri]|uniref:hypothetical protein n=1 Tax=Streptomyces fagopyri TaxID=2662397 RepID=UPI0036C675EE